MPRYEDSPDGAALSLATLELIAPTAATVPLIVKSAVGQAVNMTEWRNSNDVMLARVLNTGAFTAPNFYVGTVPANVSNSMVSNSAANVALLVKGVAAQTAALQQWRDSADVVVLSVNVTGAIRGGNFGDTNSSGPYLIPGTSNMLLFTRNAGNKGLVIQGMAAQTGNLIECQNDAATVLAAIRADGRFDFGALTQLTVGAAGAASALPATPTKYLKVTDVSGTTFVVPAYAAA